MNTIFGITTVPSRGWHYYIHHQTDTDKTQAIERLRKGLDSSYTVDSNGRTTGTSKYYGFYIYHLRLPRKRRTTAIWVKQEVWRIVLDDSFELVLRENYPNDWAALTDRRVYDNKDAKLLQHEYCVLPAECFAIFNAVAEALKKD